MPKREKLYLEHMLDTARKVEKKVEGKGRSDFDGDENLRYALIHLLQIIGEAARHVSPLYRQRHPSIPWDAIIGMRNRLVHDYLGVDEDIVWTTATQELGILISELEAMLAEEASEETD